MTNGDIRFCSSLKAVSDEFGVSYQTIQTWKYDLNCPFLEKAPYDLEAIRKWLNSSAENKLDMGSLSKAKLEAELKQLKNRNDVFSKDKTFWLALAAFGVAISREIREWQNDPHTSYESSQLREWIIPRFREFALARGYTKYRVISEAPVRESVVRRAYVCKPVSGKDALELLSYIDDGKLGLDRTKELVRIPLERK